MKNVLTQLLFGLFIFTYSYSMEESTKPKFPQVDDPEQSNKTNKYEKKYESDYKSKKRTDSSKKNKQSVDETDPIAEVISEINGVLQPIQHLKSKAVLDTINDLNSKLINAKALWIISNLPPELRYIMALSIVRQDIALKANNFLQNIDQMTCQKIAEQLNKIKNEVKRYAIDLLIFFHDIDIYENNSNIKTENKLQEFIEYKNGFLKALLPYFIAIIMYKLNNLSPKVKIEFCACLIEAICAKAPGISPGYYNIKVCNKNPWKLVIDELLQTFSNEDLPMIIIDWIVQNNNCELMKKVLSNPIFLEQINYPHNREFKARMLRKALHNFAFEMAELLIHHKLYPAQENLRTNWLNEILDLLALIPDDENSINQCCKLIRLLFEHGTQLEGKLLQILIFGGYNTAIERNLCFRMREQEDPENSIKKLLEDAKDKALRFY